MALSDTPAKRCLTVVAWTLHNNKTLLVKHKKLGIWLAPGGHVEDNELPHQAAEREFEEETGVKVKALSALPFPVGTTSEYLPTPFTSNLHWINKPRGDSFCEQHYTFNYFVRVTDDSGLHDHDEGVDGVGWFSRDEIKSLETTDDIKNEAYYVFDHFPHI